MKLALLGGDPIRKTPYPTHTTIIDDAEEKAVIEVLEGIYQVFQLVQVKDFLVAKK